MPQTNEGKIHLGYMYPGDDPTLSIAKSITISQASSKQKCRLAMLSYYRVVLGLDEPCYAARNTGGHRLLRWTNDGIAAVTDRVG